MAQIKISNDILELQDNEKTYFDADSAIGATTLTANGTNFAVNDFIVLGKLGQEKSEIVKISAVSSTAITVNATTFAHNRGDLISFTPYDKIVPERSTDGGLNYSLLSTVDIQADNHDTIIQRPTDAATDYYRVRFQNSHTSTFSDYSDVVIGSGYADNSVFSIKKRALKSMGESVGDLITDEFLNESLWEGRRELANQLLRWSFRTKFNQDIGDVLPGAWSVAVPTDLEDQNTNKNILELRIGKDGWPLEYQDNARFRQNYLNVAHTTLATAITGASTTLVLTSSGDFDESGTVDIAASTVAQTRDNVAYTANSEVTKTLSGVTGIADSKSAGVDVWQNATFGMPRAYTISDGVIYFDVPFGDDLAGENIKMDYYGSLVAYDSDADILDEPDYDMFVSWLRFKIKYLKSNGTVDTENDADYKEYKRRSQTLIEGEILGQEIHFYPG